MKDDKPVGQPCCQCHAAGDDLIRQVQAELDAEELDRRKCAVKQVLRELKAARQVVRSLEAKLKMVANVC